MPELVPLPARRRAHRRRAVRIGASTVVQCASGDADPSRAPPRDLTEWIRRATGFRADRDGRAAGAAGKPDRRSASIRRGRRSAPKATSSTIEPTRLALTAPDARPASSMARRRIRQLLPYSAEYEALLFPEPRAGDAAGASHQRHAALRLARGDARRRAPLLHRGRGQTVRRSARAAQDEPAAPAPVGRPGLADRDQEVDGPDAEGRRGPRSAARPAGSTRRPSTRISSPTRRSASSRSFPRSTCRATPTRRSRRTPN